MLNAIKRKNYILGFVLVLFILGCLLMMGLPTRSVSAELATEYPDLKFTLYTNNGVSEYKVTALNRNLTTAIIPDYIDVGTEKIPVSELSDNCFTNCKKLESVEIPSTVTRIGNNAFSGCTNLERVVGMTNVKILGNNAFSNCSAIDNLILPANLEYVGSSIIKNVSNDIYSRRSEAQMTALNANWDLGRAETSRLIFGNKLVYEDVTVDGVEGYKVRTCQNLAQEEDFVVYSSGRRNETEEYKPVFEIDRNAFDSCIFGSLTIVHDKELEFDHQINIKTNAFSNITAKYIKIDVGITLEDSDEQDPTYLEGENGKAVGVFEFADVETIILPTNIDFDRITRNMFAWCSVSTIKTTDESLGLNHLPKNIKRIDSSAFEGVANIENIFIPSSVILMGENVFNMWGDVGDLLSRTITVNMSEPHSDWSTHWNEGINFDNVDVVFDDTNATYTVTLDKQEGSGGTNSVEAEYNLPMPSAEAPTRLNYVFQGYFSGKNGSGIRYYNSDMTSAREWDKKSESTLYAHWKGIESTITFDKQGGYDGTNETIAEYGIFMPTNVKAPKRDNYIFQGYFSEKNGEGTKYYDKNMTGQKDWDKTEKTTLYACWRGIESNVTLDKQGGSGGTDSVMAEYGAKMPDATAPTLANYVFKGYYSEPKGRGIQYYNADMTSAKEWDQISDETLYAYWNGEESTVKFNKNGGQGGTDSVIAVFGEKMPDATAPTRIGHTFNGYYDNNGIKYYNDDMGSARDWDKNQDTTLTAKWTANTYTVSLNQNGGAGGTSFVMVTYGDQMPEAIAPNPRYGYTFGGYYKNGIQYYSIGMTSVRNWDIDDDAELWAKWTPVTCTIILDKQGGIGGSDNITIHFGGTISFSAQNPPTRRGYNFKGYYTKTNGAGNQFFDEKMNIMYPWDVEGTTRIYAYWEAQSYFVTLDKDGGSGGTSLITVTYDQPMPSAKKPSRTDYIFKGYYTEKKGGGTQYYNSEMGSVRNWNFVYEENNLANVTVLYAKWEEDTCVAAGTLITLADGSQKAVELLNSNDMLLVWNLYTGKFDFAPILFIDSDPVNMYKVVNLYFSDGTIVKVIGEHGFWDVNLNMYVYLREDATKYIGHWFNKQTIDESGDFQYISVQLIDVVVKEEYTTAWSPVTFGHLCYYVNGMLSMPGATEDLVNIFEVDRATMSVNHESFMADIEKYGLFSYDEFNEIFNISETVFEAFGGKYLKVAIGKGLIDLNSIEALIERYADFFETL